MYQPYRVHLARNSSEVISGITGKLNAVTSGVLLPLQSLVSSLVLTVGVVTTLVLIDPVVATVGIAGFGSCYAAITLVLRHRLRRNSLVLAYEHTKVIKCLQEGTGGIREILLDGTQPFFTGVYERSDRRFRLAGGSNTLITSSPRYVMEALGIVLIAVLAFGLSRRVDGLAASLPVLGALAVGAQRLLPAMQQSYAAWTGIVANQALVAEVVDLLDQPMPDWSGGPSPQPLPLNEAVHLDSVSYRYEPDGPLVLEDVTMEIVQGATVGLVGSTGAGKSTALDLLMGLLEPTSGNVLVDGLPIVGSRRRAWQRKVAHVPQSIFLIDASLAENIAFGVHQDEVDMTRVREAASLAVIANFIESSPEGYNARVGERGIRLSGGQRQRIGIARALYKRASVLVLDEATSALDNETERLVIDSINRYGDGLTVIVVAHRLKTVERCDIIYQLDGGRLVAQGTLEELLSNNSSFRQMASLVD
jgi:ATP-binding cassette subfamily B protein